MIKHLSRSLWIIGLFLLPTFSIQAQDDEIPQAVLATFGDMFPNAEEMDWFADEDEYAVSFAEDSYNLEANFKSNGDWIQTSKTIELDDLPTAATKMIVAEYGKPEYFINLVQIQRPGKMYYYVSFETIKKTVTLTFDANGKMTEREEEDIDDGK